MNKKLILLSILLLFVLSYFLLRNLPKNQTQQIIHIAAASNLKPAMEEFKQRFESKNPKIKIKIIYGPSGIIAQHILRGAPYDFFLSADKDYPEIIEKSGIAYDTSYVYALGRLVMWSSSVELSKGLKTLLLPEVKKIAIANSEVAPYGQATVRLLKKENLYNSISHKITWGDNITQTAHFAYSGNAEIAFISLSLALTDKMKNKGNYYLIPDSLSPPIKQACIILKNGKGTVDATKFKRFIINKENQDIWIKYGYEIP